MSNSTLVRDVAIGGGSYVAACLLVGCFGFFINYRWLRTKEKVAAGWRRRVPFAAAGRLRVAGITGGAAVGHGFS